MTYQRRWDEDPDVGAWVAEHSSGIVEIDLTGAKLWDGATLTIGEKPYLVRMSMVACLVANCDCVRGANILLYPLDEGNPYTLKEVRELLVSTLKRLVCE